MRDRRKYEQGTYLDVEYPWGTYLGGRALCADGKVRRIHRIAITADTFFSIPASVVVNHHGVRHTVAGYVSIDTTLNEVVRFHAYVTGKNQHLLVDNPCIHCGCPTREFGTQAMSMLVSRDLPWEEQERCEASPTGKHQRKEEA